MPCNELVLHQDKCKTSKGHLIAMQCTMTFFVFVLPLNFEGWGLQFFLGNCGRSGKEIDVSSPDLWALRSQHLKTTCTVKRLEKVHEAAFQLIASCVPLQKCRLFPSGGMPRFRYTGTSQISFPCWETCRVACLSLKRALIWACCPSIDELDSLIEAFRAWRFTIFFF